MDFAYISAKDNARIKRLSKLQKSARFRLEEGCFVLEGLRTIDDAADNGISLSQLYFTEEMYNKHPAHIKKFAQISAFTAIIGKGAANAISDTASPQGVFAVAKLPTLSFEAMQGKKYLALENLQDPSNLGAISRTAEALGIDGIIITENSCDPFSPKSIRASMGTLLRMPIMIVDDMCNFIKSTKLTSFACVVDNTAQSINTASFIDGAVCVIGNEANGLQKETADACTHKITIPMRGRAESLNAAVAASIVMWEMVK